MKKVLFLFVALVSMVCTMTTFSSCETKQINGANSSVVSDIQIYKDQVSDETLADATATIDRIDARLVKMFGKVFFVECKTEDLPTADDFLPFNVRISDDKEINKEIDHLKTLKTTEGHRAVTSVLFKYINGTYVFHTFKIEL